VVTGREGHLDHAKSIVGFRLEGALFLMPGGSWPYAIVSLATATILPLNSLALRIGDAAATISPLT